MLKHSVWLRVHFLLLGDQGVELQLLLQHHVYLHTTMSLHDKGKCKPPQLNVFLIRAVMAMVFFHSNRNPKTVYNLNTGRGDEWIPVLQVQ